MRSKVLLAAIFGLASCTFSARAQFDEMVKKVPASTNAIAFVNVEKLMASPIAVKEKWAAKKDSAFASGISFLPSDTKFALLPMQIEHESWAPMWEGAIMEIDHEPSQAKAVALTGGKADTIIGREAVALPGNAYLVRLATRTVAFMAPANRQAVARWMKEIDSRPEMGLSPYLTEAYSYANEVGTPIILAMDLEDAITPQSLTARMAEEKEFLTKYKLVPAEMAGLLSTVRGITLGIVFSDKTFGKLRVDFGTNVTLEPETAKAALLHVLAKRGVMIDEFEEWKSAVKGKTFYLEGNLGPSGMMRISSLFNRPPSLKLPEVIMDEQKVMTKEEQIVAASQNYFKKINKLYSDLRSQKAGNSSYTMPQLGVWMSKYAAKIDQLSVLNVDPELVEYGANAADLLRGGYDAIRTGSSEARIRTVNTPMQYDYYSYGNTYGYAYNAYGEGGPVGNYGTYGVANTAAYNHARTAIKTEERVKSGTQARSSIQALEQATADIKKKMTIKYQVDF